MIKKEEMKAKLNNMKEGVKKHGKFIAGISIGIGVMALKDWALDSPKGSKGSFGIMKNNSTRAIKVEIAMKNRIGLTNRYAVKYDTNSRNYDQMSEIFEKAISMDKETK